MHGDRFWLQGDAPGRAQLYESQFRRGANDEVHVQASTGVA